MPRALELLKTALVGPTQNIGAVRGETRPPILAETGSGIFEKPLSSFYWGGGVGSIFEERESRESSSENVNVLNVSPPLIPEFWLHTTDSKRLMMHKIVIACIH